MKYNDRGQNKQEIAQKTHFLSTQNLYHYRRKQSTSRVFPTLYDLLTIVIRLYNFWPPCCIIILHVAHVLTFRKPSCIFKQFFTYFLLLERFNGALEYCTKLQWYTSFYNKVKIKNHASIVKKFSQWGLPSCAHKHTEWTKKHCDITCILWKNSILIHP